MSDSVSTRPPRSTACSRPPPTNATSASLIQPTGEPWSTPTGTLDVGVPAASANTTRVPPAVRSTYATDWPDRETHSASVGMRTSPGSLPVPAPVSSRLPLRATTASDPSPAPATRSGASCCGVVMLVIPWVPGPAAGAVPNSTCTSVDSG